MKPETLVRIAISTIAAVVAVGVYLGLGAVWVTLGPAVVGLIIVAALAFAAAYWYDLTHPDTE